MFRALLAHHKAVQSVVQNSCNNWQNKFTTSRVCKKRVVQNKYKISSNRFIKFIIIPDDGPKGAKHVGDIILKYIQQDATLQSLVYLETALHFSGGTSTRNM